jgi:hypothetical protein
MNRKPRYSQKKHSHSTPYNLFSKKSFRFASRKKRSSTTCLQIESEKKKSIKCLAKKTRSTKVIQPLASLDERNQKQNHAKKNNSFIQNSIIDQILIFYQDFNRVYLEIKIEIIACASRHLTMNIQNMCRVASPGDRTGALDEVPQFSGWLDVCQTCREKRCGRSELATPQHNLYALATDRPINVI